jgi:hypothetical protein
MVPIAVIRERVRQRCEQIEGEPCSDEDLNLLWMVLAILADGRIEDLVQSGPPDQRADARERFLALQAGYRGELELMGQFLDYWRAKARQWGCGPEEARKEAMGFLQRDYDMAAALPPIVPGRPYRFREIRERIRVKLQICGTPEEGSLLVVCWVLVKLVFDRSGLSLRLLSTEPSHWSPEMEGGLDRICHRYAEELELLDREIRRLVRATSSLSDRASYRLLTRRLNREFLGRSRR